MSTKVANFCPDCGQQLGAGDKFCPKCGQPIGTASASIEDDDRLFCPRCQQEVMPDAPGAHQCYCPNCGMIDPVSKQYLDRQQSARIYTQGQISGVSANVPSEVRRWSWPAFWLMVPWLFAHGLTGWAVAMLVVIPLVLIPFVGILLVIADWVVFFYLCIHGNELAWKSGQYRDLDQFLLRERAWTKAILLVIILAVVGGCLIGGFAVIWDQIMHGGARKLQSLGLSPPG